MSGPPQEGNSFHEAHVARLLASYRRWTGRDLVEPAGTLFDRARRLWDAPFAVVSGGTEADPIFNYGNRFALERFEMRWEEFTEMPSRLSAEPVHQGERSRLLAVVAETGYLDN